MKSLCPSCKKNDIKFLFINKDRMFFSAAVFHVYKCNNCGLIFIGEDLQEADLAQYYPTSYYTNVNPKKTLLNSLALYCKKKNNFLLNILLERVFLSLGTVPVVPPFGACKLLDIGCGGGGLLDRMKLFGWETSGYDIDKKVGQSISNRHRFIDDLKLESEKYDLITMTDVVEHVVDFKKLLLEAYRLLDHQGVFILTTPTTSIFFRLFGKYWYPLDTPRHLYVFNKENISNCLHEAGFEVKKIKKINLFAYFFNSLDYATGHHLSFIIKMVMKLRIMTIINVLIHGVFGYFGAGETLLIYARKK